MKAKHYFEGLNGLRFLAALFVFVHHVEQHKYWMHFDNLWAVAWIDNLGHQSRVLFFVLSGFLITYFFLREKESTGRIDWMKFQMRRALRLWPVYFLVVAVGLFILPQYFTIGNLNKHLEDDWNKFVVIYFTMLPNLARLLPPIMGVYQFWSVGVQEQFYWIWPVLVSLFYGKFFRFLIVFIAAKLAFEFLLDFYWSTVDPNTVLYLRLDQLLRMSELLLFEQMAIGALAAYFIYYNKESVLIWLFDRRILLLTAGLFVFLLFQTIHFRGYTVLQGVIAAILILNISVNRKFPVKLNNRVWEYLGSLSFGMYAFHTLSIAIVISIPGLMNQGLIMSNLLLYFLSLSLTLGLSALSYHYFESYFMAFKEKLRKSGKVRQQQVASSVSDV